MGTLALVFVAAVALACDDDSKTTTATIQVKNSCKVKVTTAFSENKCSLELKTINTEGGHNAGWSPGHLIDHDSMKLDPAQEPETQNAEWVTISYVNGSIQSIKRGERSKKSRTAARPAGAAGPTAQSAPNPY